MGKIKKNYIKWFLPHLRKSFADSTISTNDLIVALSEQYATTKDVYNSINYDIEAKEILKHFIDNGYSDFIFYDMVHINPNRVYRKIENGEIINIPACELKKHLDINKDENDYEYDY